MSKCFSITKTKIKEWSISFTHIGEFVPRENGNQYISVKLDSDKESIHLLNSVGVYIFIPAYVSESPEVNVEEVLYVGSTSQDKGFKKRFKDYQEHFRHGKNPSKDRFVHRAMDAWYQYNNDTRQVAMIDPKRFIQIYVHAVQLEGMDKIEKKAKISKIERGLIRPYFNSTT